MGKQKRRRKSAKRKAREVAVPAADIVHVDVPKGTIPVIAHDPIKSTVTVVTVPIAKVKEKGWMDWLFGTDPVR